MPYKKIAFFAVLIALLFMVNNLIHSIYSIWQKQDLLVQAKKTLTAAKQENQKLKKEIAQANQPQFVETEARNKLLLGKPGEGIIILPENQVTATASSTPETSNSKPNWQQWWNIFFGS